MNYNHCLCCLKSLDASSTQEKSQGFHKSCLKKIFGKAVLPDVELSDDILEQLAQKSSRDGITVAGVQKKLSLHLISENTSDAQLRLTLLGYPQGYILKPQSSEFAFLPQNEHIVMTMANIAKIHTVLHSLIPLSDNSLAYITKRIDRDTTNPDVSNKIHMEDFCQLSERLTEDKYKGSYEQCAKIIKDFSSQPGLDLNEFFYRLVFCFITGNSDMHLKNFSLIHKNGITLSDAYDLLSVNLAMPDDKEETALTLNGKKSRIYKKDFLEFARSIKIPEDSAKKMILHLISLKDDFCNTARSSLLPEQMQQFLCDLITERCQRLS